MSACKYTWVHVNTQDSTQEYTGVHRCKQQLKRVQKSTQEYARVCTSMQKYARVFKSMQEYTREHNSRKEENYTFLLPKFYRLSLNNYCYYHATAILTTVTGCPLYSL